MTTSLARQFAFGLETEYLLVDADSFRPLWHRDLTFDSLNRVLEAIGVGDLPPLDGLELESPHRKLMPYVVEGYHVPDPDMNPTDVKPKGVEIRTPVCRSIGECLSCLRALHARLQSALGGIALQAVSISHHPTETHFEGAQNKRRHDFWQWALQAMLTYGPDVNVSLPARFIERLDLPDLHAKVNYYAPALTALTLASPIYRGGLWHIRGRVGKSIRTYRRSVIAPAIEVHLNEGGRLEYKTFETSTSLADFHAYFLLWLELLLDDGLTGRASDQSRIYDLGAVARDGLDVGTIRERAAEVLDRAPHVLSLHDFDAQPLEPFAQRLDSGRLPADDFIQWFERDPSVPSLLRRLTELVPEVSCSVTRRPQLLENTP
jgi:carboxylate-amine ligase